jgi:uncharacterized cupin superfamily protein
MNKTQFKARKSRIDEVIDALVVDAIHDKEMVSSDELKRRRIIEGALAGAESEATRRGASDARLSRLRVASVIAASIAIVAVTWFLASPRTVSSPESLPSSETPVEKTTRQPYRQAAGPPSEVSSCADMDFAPGIRAVATEDARFTVDRTRPNRITVRITRGAVWVTKNPETRQTQLEIETPKGTVMVTGTVFSVHVTPRVLEVAVLRGTVRVTDEAGASHTVSAGNVATVDDEGTEVGALPRPEETVAEFVRLGIIEEDDAPSTERTPPPQTRPRGERRQSPREQEEQHLSAEALLDRISLLRQQRDWAGMSTAYERLIRGHRGTSQASLAMVSLGNLLIEKLDEPESALRWFETYLDASPGALVPEALFGKAKALRRLGDRRAELTTLKEIVTRYPQSLYARQAAEWIAGEAP